MLEEMDATQTHLSEFGDVLDELPAKTSFAGALEEMSVSADVPAAHAPMYGIEPATPNTTPKLGQMDDTDDRGETYGIVPCDGCDHVVLARNSHGFVTYEDGTTLCGQCRDAGRGTY